MSYIRTEKINGKYKFVHARNCDICNTSFETFKGNKTPIQSTFNVCSAVCRREYFKSISYKKLICKKCNKESLVYKSNTSQFCSHICYTEYVKLHPEKFNLADRAYNMRQGMDKEAAIKKMLNTKKDRGLILHNINNPNLDWIKYWKVCNYHTKKMRKIMFETWDGYDYIDGEYIKDFINLHYSDSKYPSLDHIKPRSLCFKEGMTVAECCDISNLAWTTRINNSKKYNSYDKKNNINNNCLNQY
jgi:hypothetical protein